MPTELPRPIIMAKAFGDARVRIHTFISAFTGDNIANATHIIESPNCLVLVDGQFLSFYARKFREYADRLRKPIERLYLSHRHPDHWFGLATAFADIPVYALSETKSFLETDGVASIQDHWKLGDFAPETVPIPQKIVSPGEETIDGVQYVLEEVTNTEIDFLLSIGLPELRVCIPQDLVYSGTHLYLTKEMGHWISVLETLLLSDYEVFLAGHGLPADKNEVARNIEYLSAARQAAGDGLTDTAFRDFLLKRYPERRCPGIFDIYMPRLFGNAQDF